MTAPQDAPTRPPMARFGRWLWGWAKSIMVALAVWMVVTTFFIKAFRIPSGSMERTLLIGDFLFVNKLLYGAEIPLTSRHLPAIREPRHDEIVTIMSPIEDLLLVKRLVGLPGDTIGMVDGHLIRNGLPVPEPYVTLHPTAPEIDAATAEQMRRWQVQHLVGRAPDDYHPDLWNWGPLLIPPGMLMTMGDNRDESFDCRTYGFIPRANLQGSPLFVYFSYDPSSWRPLPFLTSIRWRRLLSSPH